MRPSPPPNSPSDPTVPPGPDTASKPAHRGDRVARTPQRRGLVPAPRTAVVLRADLRSSCPRPLGGAIRGRGEHVAACCNTHSTNTAVTAVWRTPRPGHIPGRARLMCRWRRSCPMVAVTTSPLTARRPSPHPGGMSSPGLSPAHTQLHHTTVSEGGTARRAGVRAWGLWPLCVRWQRRGEEL